MGIDILKSLGIAQVREHLVSVANTSSNGSKDCTDRDMDTEMKQENQDQGSEVTVSCPVLRKSVIKFLTIDQKWQVDLADHKEIKTEGGDQKIKKVRLFIVPRLFTS